MGYFPPVQFPCYLTPAAVRRAIGTNAQSTNDDDILLWIADDVSRKIEKHTNRRFYPRYGTALVDWPRNSFELDLPDDLISLTTLTNGDGNTISLANVYYYLADRYPRYKIQLGINTGSVFLFSGTPQQAISLNGLWGYPSDEITGQYYVATSATVQNATSQNDTTTTLLTQTGNFYAGQTLLIGTEFELIQSILTGTPNDTLTVKRSACGSTAAAHLNGVAINLVLHHPAIVRAAYRTIAWNYRLKDDALFGTSGIKGIGLATIPLAIPADVEDDLADFHRGHR